ncbi:MAG: alpha-L-rhamnosidase [Actinomycetia bacterium]|nr:alpha-L-rhamnosidase [Actinomycetes bacterium]
MAQTATRPVVADDTEQLAMFRREVDLTRVPSAVPARVFADGRYVLWVNGTEVARGPVRSNPRRSHYDVVDLAPHLHVGTNSLAILARHFGTARSWWMPVPPSYSLGAGSVLFEAAVDDDWLVSDSSWTCTDHTGWRPVPVPGDVASLPLESFDARDHPAGWKLAGFDDSHWAAAVEVTPMHTGADGTAGAPSEPFAMLAPPVRDAFPAGDTHHAVLVESSGRVGPQATGDPVATVLADESGGSDPSGDTLAWMRFDLGAIAAGTLSLSVEHPEAGTTIDIAAAEHEDEDGHLVTLGQHTGLRYVCNGDDHEAHESLETIGARYLHASVRTPSGVPPPSLSLAVADRVRPRPEGASFACSDPQLERIHAVGLRTVDLCATDAYLDCPTREQRAWTGDSVVHQMVDLVSNPDWSMPTWHPQLAAEARADGMLVMAAASDFAADDRTYIPDWSLHWVRSLHNLHLYTGDRELVAELLPVAERTLRWFEQYLADDGLLHDIGGWTLIDWASVYSTGCSSVLNALWARGLEDYADMARWLGNHGAAGWADRRRDGVAGAFEAFWDDGRGVYVDHIVDGQQGRPAAQHGGAAALAAGIVPAGRTDRIIGRLTDRDRLVRHSFVMDTVEVGGDSSGMMHLVTGYPDPTWDVEDEMVEAEPFFRYVLHDGLARAGRADLVAELCRDWQVFLDAGESTWPECWRGGTRCHGWSSTPTRDLVVHTLGIRPAEPGYAAVSVEPALGELDWARATVPTPHGPVTVEARGDGSLDIDSPVPVTTA